MSTVSDTRKPPSTRRLDSPPQKKPASAKTEVADDPRRKKLIAYTIAAFVLAGAGWLISSQSDEWAKPDLDLVYYEAVRGSLAITVKERGNLESQQNEKIVCEVDDIRGDGMDGTPILWLIDNGASVAEGDLLVQLDSSGHLQRLDEKLLELEQQQAKMIQSRSKYENQKSENRKTQADAELKVRLAKIDLEMFQDKESGTAHLEIEEIRRSIDEINNEILQAQASLKLKAHEKTGTESLFKMGYAGKSELDRSRLEFLQAESTYAAKLNSLKTTLASLKKKEVYEHVKEELTLKGNLATAERDLEQQIITNNAELEQAKAAMVADQRAFEKEKELEARYRERLEKCKIFAPSDGMVAYAKPHRWHPPISVGATAHDRQHLISLPNLSKMQVRTAVHESVLDQVKVGLPATIRLDAYNEISYSGSVKSVAVMPDQNGWSGDTKVYETVVTIDEDVTKLKPGMTAVVEIHIEELRDVVSIPVQAIVQRQKQTWAYIDNGGEIERRELILGKTNTKFVEVKSGISEGDQVVLNPMAIFEASDEESDSDSEDEMSEDEVDGAKGNKPEGNEEQESDQPGENSSTQADNSSSKSTMTSATKSPKNTERPSNHNEVAAVTTDKTTSATTAQ